jgi:hypothetical protein
MDATSLEFWVRILVSLLCGGIIGLERQIRGKPAGIRTSILRRCWQAETNIGFWPRSSRVSVSLVPVS